MVVNKVVALSQLQNIWKDFWGRKEFEGDFLFEFFNAQRRAYVLDSSIG